jgi:streptogramin lyase
MQSRWIVSLIGAFTVAALTLSACSGRESGGVLPAQKPTRNLLGSSANQGYFGDVTTVLNTGPFAALAWDPDDGILLGIPNETFYSSAPRVLIGSQGAFVFPQSVAGVVYDSNAHLFYFTDQHNLYSSNANGQLKIVTTSLGDATALAVDGAGSVYAIDGDHVDRIRNGKVTIVALPGTVTPSNAQNFGNPSLAFDIADRSLYLADTYGDVVKRILRNGRALVVAGHCIPGSYDSGCIPGSIEGSGKSALFGSPSGLVYDIRRNVFVMADARNNQLWELRSDGDAKIVAGYGPVADYDGNAWRAFFNEPNGLTYAKDLGKIYVSDNQHLATYAVTGPQSPAVAEPTLRFPFANPNSQMGFPTVRNGTAWFVLDYSIESLTSNGQMRSYKPPGRPSAFGQIVIDRHGTLWFLVQNGIVSMSRDGAFQRYDLPKGHVSNTNSPIIGPDGNLWFADQDAISPAIGTIANGKMVLYSLGSGLGARGANWLMSGPDGSVWFTTSRKEIDRMSISGKLLARISLKSASPSQMVYNKKSGDTWFLDNVDSAIVYRMTPDRIVHEFAVCSCTGTYISNIAVTNNDVAFVAENSDAVDRITADGTVTSYYVPSTNAGVYGVAATDETSIWITTGSGQAFLLDPVLYAKSGLPQSPTPSFTSAGNERPNASRSRKGGR